MPDLNTNQIAAGAAAALAKDFLSTLLTTIPAKIATFVSRYFDNLQGSVERNLATCSTVRTIINKDKPVPLDSIYVKGRFRCDDQMVNDDEISQLVRDGRRIVVSGFGGIGKTVLCKYIWLSIFRNPEGKVPIFFELRNLNDITEKDLITYIRISLTAKNVSVPHDQFLSMMAQGRFIFILDGFDEIPDDNRFEIQRQILEISSQYPDCGFVVSSRADERFASWQEFYSYHAVAFDKEQAREVIANVDFDTEIKKEFVSEILNKRYGDYESFFATPLLTLMMLMTYLQIKYIPDSPHVFYRYAFQTLYTLHDASKQGFQRKRYVNMSESDFINVFSLFCLVSYIDMEHTFQKGEIISYLDNVKTKAKVKYDSEMFLEECIESVNLIYKDGERYAFTHRSFQEYFSAYAATHYFPKKLIELMERIPLRSTDSVFSMMYQINPDAVEELYIIPNFERIKDPISRATKIVDPLEFLSEIDARFFFILVNSKGKHPFAHVSSYKSAMERFSRTMVLMFKNEFPNETPGRIDYRKIDKVINVLRNFISTDSELSSLGSGASHIDIIISKRMLSVRFSDEKGAFFEPIEPRFSKEISFEQAGIGDRELAMLASSASTTKAELVFAQKKAESIIRAVNKTKKSGLDILSL